VDVAATLRTVQERHAPVEDYAVLDLRFPAARGRIELSWAAEGRANDGEIVGTRGTIRIADEGVTISSRDGTVDHRYGERLSDSSYHPDWFGALFASILADARREQGRENMREAGMLVDTLFKAYGRTQDSAAAPARGAIGAATPAAQ
jgi:predicted dehydrogenase